MIWRISGSNELYSGYYVVSVLKCLAPTWTNVLWGPRSWDFHPRPQAPGCHLSRQCRQCCPYYPTAQDGKANGERSERKNNKEQLHICRLLIWKCKEYIWASVYYVLWHYIDSQKQLSIFSYISLLDYMQRFVAVVPFVLCLNPDINSSFVIHLHPPQHNNVNWDRQK